MSSTRHPLAPSLSFSGSPSTVINRPLKRRLTTTDVNFFTTAATSFKPRPYAPNGSTGPQSKASQVARANYRSVESLAIPSPIMDPTPDDLNVVFIHPPFTNFPEAHLIPDGLSYALMAANPNWFLDPYDFKSASSTNPNAIPYPPHLEPPRGWCPAKKRDLKSRGSDGWPEGEEPRLRCTFCRRTYAGVNAKSMWRRHVFEKHKIAMSNRRDGNERPRGRGSNKENKQLVPQAAETSSSNTIGLNFTYACEPEMASSLGSKLCSTIPVNDDGIQNCDTRHPALADTAHPFESRIDPRLSPPHLLTGSALQSMSPPVTPYLLHSSDSSDSQGSFTTMSPIVSLQMDPPSPYDPLLTPSFRHSPPSLPSDQPWRFPSPSHPLHSSVQNMCLTMLTPMTATPVTKTVPLRDASPSGIGPNGLDAESAKLESSPQTSLFKSRFPVSATGRFNHEKNGCLVNQSPLSRNIRTPVIDRKFQLTSPSKLSDTWISDNSADLGPRVSQDPFEDIYSHWLDLKIYANSHIFPALGQDSPVLRSGILPPVSTGEFGMIGMGPTPSFTLQGPSNVPHDHEYFSPLTEDESDNISMTPWSYLSIDDESKHMPQNTEIVHPQSKRRKTE